MATPYVVIGPKKAQNGPKKAKRQKTERFYKMKVISLYE